MDSIGTAIVVEFCADGGTPNPYDVVEVSAAFAYGMCAGEGCTSITSPARRTERVVVFSISSDQHFQMCADCLRADPDYFLSFR